MDIPPKGRLILCVDDEVRELRFRRLLLEAKGYKVLVATSAQEGIQAFQSNPVDLVIADHLMGRAIGIEMAAALKRLKPHVPIIILSASSGPPGRHGECGRLRMQERGGQPVKFIGTIVDVTEQKRIEETLRQAERLNSVGWIAGSLAHEINNPLAALTNALYLLRDEPLPDRAREYFNVAERELARVSRITEQALVFYRKTERPETVSLASILDEAVGLFAEQIRSRNISVERQYKGFGHVVAHPGEMRQLLTNLVANAVESGATRLALRVSAGPDWTGRFESGLRVIIADEGPGIRVEDRPRLFHPSFATRPQKGAGLGLWVAKSIVEKYRGRIVVRSSARPDAHGTSVSVFLPAVGAVPPRSRAA